MSLFNQRRKKSAYLEHDKNGRVITEIPIEEKQEETNTKDTGTDIKKIVLFIIFFIIAFLFFKQAKSMIELMKIDDTHRNIKIESSQNKNSIKLTKKEINLNREKAIANVTTFNQYDYEISSIYGSLKGYITQFYKGKESLHTTQISYNGLLERIEFDKQVMTSNEAINEELLESSNYLTRLENIEKFIKDNYENANRTEVVDAVNRTIEEENRLKIEGRKSIEAYLQENHVNYEMTDEKIVIKGEVKDGQN